MSVNTFLKSVSLPKKHRQLYGVLLVISGLTLFSLSGYHEMVEGINIPLLMGHQNMHEHAQIRILCLILTEYKDHKTKASAVNSTWASRCDQVQFVTDKDDDDLPVMVLEGFSRDTLWGKTKTMFNRSLNTSLDFDWILKADHDTYIIMENLKNLLSHFNASEPLFAGAMYACRSEVPECRDYDLVDGDEIYMTGGAGYVLSKETARRFISGHTDPTKCRPGDVGPEDVEMSRCLQRLGANFIDTRDRYGRNRFFHISGEDALSLAENIHRPDLSWISHYNILPQTEGLDCCSHQAVSFHHLTVEQIRLMEYMVYNLRPHNAEDEDLSRPMEEAVLPNRMLNHTNILEIVMNVRNLTMRKLILSNQDINYIEAGEVLKKEEDKETLLSVGDSVFLILDVAMKLPKRVFKVEQIVYGDEPTWLVLNNTNSDRCKIELNKVTLVHEINSEDQHKDEEEVQNEEINSEVQYEEIDNEEQNKETIIHENNGNEINAENKNASFGENKEESTKNISTVEPKPTNIPESISFCA